MFVTTISGFLPQFEMSDVELAEELGCNIHYASDFENSIYPFDQDALIKKGIKLHRISVKKNPARFFDNFRAFVSLRRIIDREEIDMIHCHNPMGGVVARAAARFSKRHPYVIYTAHGFHFYDGAPLKNWLLYYPAEKFLARWTDRIITINREDYLRAVKFHVRKKWNVSQIHGVGVDPDRFRPRPEIRESKRKEIEVPADAFHIVTAAELNDNKNQKVIIEAIAAIKSDRIYYSICGKGPNEEKLKELIGKYDLSDRVRLLGYRTDMEEILQTADVFAFPSKREGFGVAAVEALLSGVPLIASDTRGIREYAVDGGNSIICRSGSAIEYAEAINRFAEDKEMLERYSALCRDSALKFTTDEIRKSMRPIYEDAIMRVGK
ncbi:MAG: glycosyltransferase family 4 protein [Lachnospiraceae bacterium]|nr:glycosyltransferase family 4 protein [Lachnospiraceae bacterium]